MELAGFSLEEAADYLLHHLRIAGGRAEAILVDEALEILARATGGVPRLLNQAAYQALCLAEEFDGTVVDAEVALEALSRLGLSDGAECKDEAGSAEALSETIRVAV